MSYIKKKDDCRVLGHLPSHFSTPPGGLRFCAKSGFINDSGMILAQAPCARLRPLRPNFEISSWNNCDFHYIYFAHVRKSGPAPNSESEHEALAARSDAALFDEQVNGCVSELAVCHSSKASSDEFTNSATGKDLMLSEHIDDSLHTHG
jgi:hypothetical protein